MPAQRTWVNSSSMRRIGRVVLVALSGLPLAASAAFGGINSWTSGGPGGAIGYVLAIDPITPSTLYVGTDQGVFRTMDGGATWISVSSGLPPLSVTGLAIDPIAPATIYAGVFRGGIFKSTNRGASWAPAGLSGLEVFGLTIDPRSPSTLYAAISSGAGGIFKSIDGAATWNSASAGLTVPWSYSVVVDPSNSMILYAGTSGGWVSKSVNGGMSWTPSGLGLTSGYIY